MPPEAKFKQGLQTFCFAAVLDSLSIFNLKYLQYQ